MSDILRLLVLFCGIGFVLMVFVLLVKRKINERNSLLWLVGAFIILVLSIAPNTLQVLAEVFDVDYPPSLLFLFSTLIMLLIVLYQSLQISVLQEHLRELTQQIAVDRTRVNIHTKNSSNDKGEN